MIVETLVTTCDDDGCFNLAPMGPHLDDDWERDPTAPPKFVLRPFVGSTTHRNLLSTGAAVIHFSSDASLFARSAVAAIRGGDVDALTIPIGDGLRRLVRCERFFAVRTRCDDPDAERPIVHCEIMEQATVDPPRGINRAAAALIELSILATRIDRLPPAMIRQQIESLTPAVDKTAGVTTRAAFDQLRRHIEQKLGVAPESVDPPMTPGAGG